MSLNLNIEFDPLQGVITSVRIPTGPRPKNPAIGASLRASPRIPVGPRFQLDVQAGAASTAELARRVGALAERLQALAAAAPSEEVQSLTLELSDLVDPPGEDQRTDPPAPIEVT